MLKNYFKTAWRNLIRNKGYSAINIGGLAAGMAVALAIGLWVHDELSFDKYFKNHDRIAQVWQHANFNGNVSSQTANPAMMGPEIKRKFGSDFKHVIQASWTNTMLLTIGTKAVKKQGIFFRTRRSGNVVA